MGKVLGKPLPEPTTASNVENTTSKHEESNKDSTGVVEFVVLVF